MKRKTFLQTLGLGALATGALAATTPKLARPHPHQGLDIGLASYTLRTLSLDEAIEVAKRLGMHSLCLKSMHLPLDSTDAAIRAAAQQVRDAGLDLYGAGVIYMKSEEEVRNAFRYAQAGDMRVIIGVPHYELLPLVEEQVKATDIKLAIHNHGPGDDVYPSPDTIWERIKNFDERIGMCIDVGHTFRIEQDPAAMLRKYKDRLHDVHLKDVDKRSAEGRSVEMGRGIMNIPACLRALSEIEYEGVVAMEYEKDAQDPVPGLAESVGYARGVLDTLA